eukprot:2734445-Rhodomonas_salina.5
MLPGRRAWNTHWRWDMVPKAPQEKGKYIYLTRSGKFSTSRPTTRWCSVMTHALLQPGTDVVCSFYHHLSNQLGDAGTFDKGFEAFFEDWYGPPLSAPTRNPVPKKAFSATRISGSLPYGKWTDHIKTWYRL